MNRIAAVAAALLLAAVPGGARAATVTVGHATVATGCGPALPVDFYWPSTAPTGVVWLTHGWLGTKDGFGELAGQIVARSGAIVVAPTVPSFDPGDGCWIFGAPMQQAIAQVIAGRTELERAAAAAGYRGALPARIVMAGHSAGGNLALAVAGYTPVQAVVMFDGAAGSIGGGQAAQALTSYQGPVYDVASEDNLADPGVLRALEQARPGRFVGVYIVGGRHLDAIGYSNWIAMWLLNDWPTNPANVTAAQQIGADWIRDALTGTDVGVYGVAGQRFTVAGATAVTLPT